MQFVGQFCDDLADAIGNVIRCQALLAEIAGEDELTKQLDAMDDRVPARKEDPVQVLDPRFVDNTGDQTSTTLGRPC